MVKNRLPMQAMQEMQVRSLGWEDPLEEKMAIHSSILAGIIPWARVHGVRMHKHTYVDIYPDCQDQSPLNTQTQRPDRPVQNLAFFWVGVGGVEVGTQDMVRGN